MHTLPINFIFNDFEMRNFSRFIFEPCVTFPTASILWLQSEIVTIIKSYRFLYNTPYVFSLSLFSFSLMFKIVIYVLAAEFSNYARFLFSILNWYLTSLILHCNNFFFFFYWDIALVLDSYQHNIRKLANWKNRYHARRNI